MISEGERKKEKDQLIINVNNQQKVINKLLIEHQVYVHKSLAFPPTEETAKMLANANDVMRRDGWSFSRFVAVAIREYLQRHPLPNPQAQIDRMVAVEMPHKAVSLCCVEGCRGKARFLLTLRSSQGKNEQFQVCAGHKRWLHPKFIFLVSYREIR